MYIYEIKGWLIGGNLAFLVKPSQLRVIQVMTGEESVWGFECSPVCKSYTSISKYKQNINIKSSTLQSSKIYIFIKNKLWFSKINFMLLLLLLTLLSLPNGFSHMLEDNMIRDVN